MRRQRHDTHWLYFLACITTVDIDTHTHLNISLDLLSNEFESLSSTFPSRKLRLLSVNSGLVVQYPVNTSTHQKHFFPTNSTSTHPSLNMTKSI